MGLFKLFFRFSSWQMRRIMKREAKHLAREVEKTYSEKKARMENATEQEIIMAIVDTTFNREKLLKLPEKYKKRIEICCKTVNGFCYIMALEAGTLTGLPNFRSLQFTTYMDKELEAKGFPKQTFKRKKKILEAMEMTVEGWEEFIKDKN